ncbi:MULTISPECIES: hypothetical protein [Bradyrhizobium]|uniref:hypothetical protein n=1 Tax=Bradyrhizobium TaxID=374 RepID=UPI00067EE528|nr:MULTISPECIES: hypothetical protein [Bradyrhizobium]PAY04140.1 hypothetical protein CK489_33285 [Bradyrhizobium sp. UFLA03-84]
MRIGVTGTHGNAARRGIPVGMCAGGNLFDRPTRNLATGTRVGSLRRLSETLNAQGSTKGAT